MKLSKATLKKMVLKEIMSWGDDEIIDVNPKNEYISNAIQLTYNAQKEIASAIAQNGGMGNNDSQTMLLVKAQRSLKEVIFYLLDAEKNESEFNSER